MATGAKAGFTGMSIEVDAILLCVALPLLRDVVFKEDGGYGAYHLAGGAVDAGVRIYVELVVLVGAVDAVNGADVNAGKVFYAYARFRDNVGRGCWPPPNDWGYLIIP